MSVYEMQLPTKQCDSMAFLELDKSCLLKADEFPGSKSAFIRDDNGKLIAKQTILKYLPTQAYCIYSDCSDAVAGKNIRVKEEDDDVHQLKLVSIDKEIENRRLLPLFVQFHHRAEARPAEAHLSDRLAESALGRFNLELKKNVTHDSFEESDSWRDEAGFIVTDRNRFAFVTYKTASLLSSLTPCAITITKFDPKDLEILCDFDASVCGFTREDAVEFIAANSTVYVAKGDGVIDGMIAAKGNRILALYAETLEIAHALMKHYIVSNRITQVSFFTMDNVWECKPMSSRCVHRRHTRTVPSNIKWNKVFALNMGFHIV
ncbi:unnamed protein product [Cylicocyclus nassatus]|uniref:DUF7596 domain-containing protein n=1 Tax=Cylicocyclus nassatus TaxID=53992 RepID=A0AA36M7S1_CYLNA|nr:unnamed protein product [Cylicocyclus nassatus]